MPISETTIETFVSPSEFLDVVLDVEKYPRFLPEVKKAEELSKKLPAGKGPPKVVESVGLMQAACQALRARGHAATACAPPTTLRFPISRASRATPSIGSRSASRRGRSVGTRVP